MSSARALGQDALCRLTLRAMARGVAAGEIDPVALVDAHLDRIAREDPVLNAYITVAALRAREEARVARLEAEQGWIRGPLHGVPMAVKDVFDTAGVRTTWGASFHAGRVPDEDAAAVRRLSAAGAVLLGKTNTGELATGSTTANAWYGTTRNPHDPTRIAGGSSGGSAAAVAGFLAPAALGTDAGGSVRGPAALCGVVGAMATRGLIPDEGCVAAGSALSQTGVLARSVADAESVLRVLCGFGSTGTADGARGGGELTLGLYDAPTNVELDGAVAEAFDNAVARLRCAGAEVLRVAYQAPGDTEEVRRVISDAEKLAAEHDRLITTPDAYGPLLRTRLERALATPPARVAAARRRRAEIMAEAQALFGGVHAVVTPAVPCVAPPAATLIAHVNGRPVPFEGLAVGLLGFANLLGAPALSVPMSGATGGLPVGLQIMGPAGSDCALLRVARWVEAVLSD